MDKDHGFIDAPTGQTGSYLRVKESNFMYNQGDVMKFSSRVDIALDTCSFIGNKAYTGTLSIEDDGASLRTSNCTFIAPAEDNKVAVFFSVTGSEVKMTDYMTYDTSFISGNTTLNTASTDNFLQEAEAAGLVIVEKFNWPYYVTQEESAFPSGTRS